jgi:hypothetical protein
MDAEMEQTALKIQSAFRGKMNLRKKSPKDNTEGSNESYESQDEFLEEDELFETSKIFESHCEDFEEISHPNAQRSPYDGNIQDEFNAFDGNKVPHMTIEVDMMESCQGGGVFPESSGESDLTIVCSSGDDPSRYPGKQNLNTKSSKSFQEDVQDQKRSFEEEKTSIKCFELQKFDKDFESAESLYYQLKQNEPETQRNIAEEEISKKEVKIPSETTSDENDDDVIILKCIETAQKKLKYGMSMDDRLLGSILSNTHSRKNNCIEDVSDPFDSSMNHTIFLKNHHPHHQTPNNFEEIKSSYDSCDPGDDEDKFDDFCNSNIRKKIMASSISIADDSDYFGNSKSIFNEDKIHTALETIHSTDSESTVSGATKVARITMSEGILAQPNLNFNMHQSHMNFSSSIGNNAIDKSLDDFIQSQELQKVCSESSKTKNIRLEDSTDDIISAEWDENTNGGIINIKVEQKNFLTIDEKRRTLHREDAIQRNSTREDDEYSKSSNASSEASDAKVSSKLDTCNKKISVTIPSSTSKFAKIIKR